eukprot:PhF_6_TR26125/c0_g1_i1/m.36983/K10260/FBXW7, SEL10; F-box and WD-40 domain protein 7
MSKLIQDPRTGLKLIEMPKDKQKHFAELGKDVLIHYFTEISKISSKGKPQRRIVFVTDQTLFLAEPTGAVTRCVQVSHITMINIAQDNSNEIALLIPSEFDVIIRFDKKIQRDDFLGVVHAVFKRMTDGDVNMQSVKEIRPNQYNMQKPAGFRVQIIPQRTMQHLQKALEAFEQSELERIQAIDTVRMKLSSEHAEEIKGKDSEIDMVSQKLNEARTQEREQKKELEKLQMEHERLRKRVNEIEVQMGTTGVVPSGKDDKIKELEETIKVLNESVSVVQQEKQKIDEMRRNGNFEEIDVTAVNVEAVRSRGKSLHTQGLIEVLQRQLIETHNEVSDLMDKEKYLAKLQQEVTRKQDQLAKLERIAEERIREGGPGAATYYHGAAGGGGGGGGGGHHDHEASSPHRSMMGGSIPTLSSSGPQAPAGFPQMPKSTTALPPMHAQFDLHGLPDDFNVHTLPENENDLKIDPRTGLKLINVDEKYANTFKDLQGALMYYFSEVNKINKRSRSQKRIIVVSDQVIFQCNVTCAINRCILIKDISEIHMDDNRQVVLRLDAKGEYDTMYQFDTQTAANEFKNIIQKCKALARQEPCQVTMFPPGRSLNISEYTLEKPADYQLVLQPIRTKRSLLKALREMAKHKQAHENAKEIQWDQYTQHVMQHLRQDMMFSFMRKKENEFKQLQQQVVIMENALKEKLREVANLRRNIADHRCTAAGGRTRAIEYYPSDGLYWIPTEPVVLDCEVEILAVQFHDNVVVTSHANGFITSWDVNKAEIIRCMKEHTARVVALQYDGSSLFSGSFDRTVRRWNCVSGTCTGVLQGHKGHVTCLQFDQSRVISGSADTNIHIWDVATMSIERVLKGHKTGITALKFEGNQLISSDWGWIFVWDIVKGITLRAFRDSTGGIATLDFFHAYLVSGGAGNDIRVWNLHTGTVDSLEGHTDDIVRVQLIEHYAVSASTDGTMRMWNLKDNRPLGVFLTSKPNPATAFQFQANRFVVAEGKTLKIYTR